MIAVIGCGNADRHDDGVGPAVVRMLNEHADASAGAGVRLVDGGTDGMEAMFAARGCRRLIIVDACRSSAPPGTVFELPGTAIEPRHARSLTMHDFRWDHALYAGRRLFPEEFPADVVVLLIEAACIEPGIGLSPAVAAAAQTVVQRIVQLLRERPLAVRVLPP
jgi:hydrogenase maturation protease